MYKKRTLYKRSKTGKIQIWEIWVDVDENNVPVIYRKSGYINGKKRQSARYIRKGTNIGKKNENTAYENAVFIANNYYKERIEDNWVDDISKVDDSPKYLKPMLAKTFSKKRIKKWENYVVQPKLNGVRAVMFSNIGDTRLISRERHEFDTMDHIRSRIIEKFGNIPTDGELYNHDLTFQEIVRRVKKYRSGLSEQIQYWVYDIPVDNVPFIERYGMIINCIGRLDKLIIPVTIEDVESYEHFKYYHDMYVKDGYEGIIIRKKDSMYMYNDRPSVLQKYKEFVDEEFKVVDSAFEEVPIHDEFFNVIRVDKLILWVCETKKGERFNVRPKNSHADRAKMYNDRHKYIGKMLTVRYQEKSETGTPIFGVGICFRDYE